MSRQRIVLEVTDEGTLRQLTVEASRLDKALKGAADTANKVSAGSKTLNAAKKMAGADREEGREYGVQRSTVGTGASARDFAKQAQGLGGLVHLYATFAANLFAASAAFNALSRAMDASNMVKGLDQIGAASGKNLGTLSKRVQEAADGAISLKESMEAVAKASSGGMSNKQILQMTDAAKKASQALGVNMSDAISRMTRGITKLEPELLDELGIMVRVDKATEDYAKSVGKTTASLTDFERRQAYANAVLKEAETKFGAIELDSNPYQKLLASITDITLKGGELINKVLGPIAKYLADSPTALTAGLAAIVAMLVKQAIPAIGMLRQNAAEAADEAGRIAEARVAAAEGAINKIKVLEDARIKSQMTKELRAIEEAADQKVRAIDETEARLKAVRSQKSGRGSAAILKELEGVLAADVTKDQLKKLDELGAKQTKTSGYYREYAESIRASQKAEQDFFAKQKEIDNFNQSSAARQAEALEKAKQGNRALREQIILADKAKADAATRAIRSNAIENTQILGMRYAYQEMNRELKAATATGTLTRFQAGWARVTGAISIASAAVATFGRAINNSLAVIGTAVAVFQLMDSFLSKNSKEMSKFSSSTDTTNDAVAGLERTLERIAKKGLGEQLSTESISARATAFGELSQAVEDMAYAFEKMDKAASGWDRFWDGMWDAVGKGSRDKLRDSIVNSITETLQTMNPGPARDAFKAKIREIYGVEATDVEGLKNVFDSATDSTAVAKYAKNTSTATKVASDGMKVTAAKATEARDALAAVHKTMQDFTNSLKDRSPIAAFGESLVTAGVSITRAMDDAEASTAALVELTKDEKALSLLPPGLREELIGTSKELETLTSKSNEYAKQLKAMDNIGLGAGSKSGMENLKRAIDERIAVLKSRVSSAGNELILQGVDKLMISYNTAIKKAQATIFGAYVEQLTGAAKISAQADLKKRELELQKEEITAMASLQDSLELVALENRNLARVMEASAAKPEDREGIRLQIEETQLEIVFRKSGLSGIADRFKQLPDKLKEGLKPFLTRQLGVGAKIAEISGQQQAVGISAKFGIAKENFAENQKQVELDIQRRKAIADRAKYISDIVGLQNIELVQNKQQADLAVISLTNTKEEASALFNLVQANEVLSKSPRNKDLKENVAQAERELAIVRENIAMRNKASESASEKELIDARLASAEHEISLAREINDIRYETANTLLSIENNRLSLLSSTSAITASAVIAEQAKVDILGQELSYVQQIASIQLEAEAELARNAAARAKAMQDTSGMGIDEIVALAKNYDNIDTRILSRSKQKIKNAQDLLKSNKETTAQLAKQNSLMSKMDDIASSLEKVFGDLGKNIGDTLKTVINIGLGDEALRKKQSDALWDAMAKGSDEYKKVEERNAKERTEFELDASAKIAGSAKNMFAEKTAAYKLFATIEQALHVMKMVNAVKEMAMDSTQTASSVANSGARSAAKGVEAVVDTLAKAPWYLKLGMAAAVAGMVASVLGGGKGSVNISGFSAKDRQETQGTGTAWKDGKKVETGGGVFGDSSAKSESIVNSLEIIKSTSVEGLSYSNKMLSALKGIKDAIAGTAESLYRVAGIRVGSAFGTTEGSKTSGITGLFGKTTTKDIIDSGVKLSGSFNDLANKVAGTIQQYETVQSTTKKSGFLGIGSSTKTSISETFKAADQAIIDSISSIFINATETFQDVGAKLGMDAETVISKLGSINVEAIASLRDLTGEDLEKEFASVISSILDDASRALFSNMEKYARFGEGMLETVVRVVDSNEKIKLAFDSIGKTYADLSFDITESLADMSEGLDSFLDKVSDYKDTFLTDAEKLAPIQAAVTKTMAELGYSTVDTRAEFKALVNSVDVTTEAGRKLWISLMEVSSSFADVTQAHQDLVDEYYDLETELLSTFRDNAAVKAALAARETKDLSELAKAQFAQNKLIEEQISTLEQYYDLMDQVEELTFSSAQLRSKERDAIAESNRVLFDYVKALEDKKQAEEDMKSSLDSISNTMSTLASEAESAASSLESALQTIVDGFNSATEALNNAEANVQSALLSISSGYQNALSAVESAQASIVAKYRSAADKLASARSATDNALAGVAKANANAAKVLRDLSTSIKKFIESLATSALSVASAPQKMQLLESQFSKLAEAARLGDQTALKDITGVAQELLQVGQEQSSSSIQYATLFGRVTSTLSGLSSSIDASVGVEDSSVDNEQSQAIAALAAARASESQASEILVKWTELAGKAGIKLEQLIVDPNEEFDDALKTYTEATEALKTWKEALIKSGADPKAKDDPAQTAYTQYLKALEDKTQAKEELDLWQKLVTENNIDIKASTKTTAQTITKYFEEWKTAKVSNDTAQRDLQTATNLLVTNGINLSASEVSAIDTLKNDINAYNTAKLVLDTANANISNTKLDSIKAAIDAMASSVVSAVTTAVTVAVTKDEPKPTVPAPNDDKIPDAKKVENIIGNSDNSKKYISGEEWMSKNQSALGLAALQSSVRLDQLRDDFYRSVGTMPSFAVGAESLPEDMIAQVHKGEKITPAKYNGKLEEALIQEVKALRAEVSMLRSSTNGTEENTRKTKQMLEQVTLGNNYIQIKAA